MKPLQNIGFSNSLMRSLRWAEMQLPGDLSR